MRNISEEQFKKQFGEETYNGFGAQAEQKQGFLSEIKSRISGVTTDIGREFRGEGEFAGQSTPRRATGIVAKAFSAPLGLTKDVLPQPLETGLEKVGEGVGKGLRFIAEKTTPQFMTDFVTKYPDAAKALEEAAGTVANVGQIAGDILGTQGGVNIAKKALTPLKKLPGAIDQGVEATLKTGGELVKQGVKDLAPKPLTPIEATRQVLQGETKSLKPGLEALKAVDTTGVKTYTDLGSKIKNTITSLSQKVDENLDNTIPVKLKDLKVNLKTAGGKNVSIDYVSRSLEHLKQLYKSVGDDVASKNIGELIQKANKVGLTRREVNNLARAYGTEFSEKAFGKTGEALTSVNAKAFELTRKGLKSVARQGLKGKEAQAIDESISSLFKVERLVNKNIESVNKLTQKIQERGLLEKVGYVASKTLDVATGGTLRGIFGGLLPRGVGYKVMNALDLEKVLQRNLEIIQKAIKAGDPEVIKLLKKMNKKGLVK